MRRSAGLCAVLVVATATSTLLAQQQSEDVESVFNVAQLHLRDGRPQLAVEQFQKALKIDPKHPYALKGLGIAYIQLKKYDKAIEAFSKALSIHPNFVDVRNDLGTALALSGRRDEARREFLTAYNDPTNAYPEFSALNLARSYYEEKSLGEATNWFQTAVARNKKFPDAILGLVTCMNDLGRQDQALAVLEGSVKDNPESALLILSLGEAYHRAGRLSEAKARLEEARKLDAAGPIGRRAGELLKSLERP